MARTVSRLQILLEAKNRASGELSNVEGQLGGLGRAVGRLAPVALAVGAAFAAWKLGNLAFDLGRASAASMRLADSFDDLTRQAGTSSQQMLSAMREASQGMIDDTSLIQSANKAMLLNVADTSKEMASLLEIAQARGRAMGLTTQQAFNDLVTGLGRASPMILDNLGITISATDAYERYAAQIGTTADQLTKQQQIQALTNAVIADSAQLLADNADKGRDMAGSFERMDASLANAKDALGGLFTPAAAAIAEQLANAADHVARAAQGMAEVNLDVNQWRTASDMVRHYDQQIAEWKEGMDGANFVVRMLQQNHLEYLQTQRDNAAAARDLFRSQMDLGTATAAVADATHMAALEASQAAGATDTLSAATAGLSQEQRVLRNEIMGTLDRLREIEGVAASAASSVRSSFLGAVGDLGAGGALAGYQEANAQLQAQVELWEHLGFSAEEIEFKTAAFVGQIREANSELGRTVSTSQTVNREFENLVSKVQGVVSGALSVGVGPDPADFLPREDAINENARRLADIMANGLRPTEWMEEFKREVPGVFKELAESDDPQAAAARMLQSFSMGLRPELLDREAIKQRVKDMITGGQNVAQIAQEIAQELSQELGVSLASAQKQVQAVMGGGGGGAGGGDTGPGTAFGQGLVDGVASKDFGAEAVKVLGAQLAAQEQLIRTHGGNAGRWYGENFVSVFGGSVPPAVVGLLARLVTPEVLAMIQERESQTGTVD